MNDVLFLSEQKNTVYDESNLLLVYMYGKGTWEDPYYFDEELPNNDNDNNDKKIKDNKIDEENKENIPDNEPVSND